MSPDILIQQSKAVQLNLVSLVFILIKFNFIT